MQARPLTMAALAMLTAMLLPKWSPAQTSPTPQVSPDPLSDVPTPPEGADPFPFFDDFSWRMFVALNWPALTGAANRGQPDRNKPFGTATGQRVWTTWKSEYEIFQQGPAPWTSYEGMNPCGGGFSNDVLTLSAFTAFADFNQALFSLRSLGNPLIAQNQTYVRYEVRVNQNEFNSIVSHKWYMAVNLPSANAPIPFDTGAVEVKAAWRIFTDKDTPAVRSRYYVVPSAQVFDVATRKCVRRDVGLVGFHIVTKTAARPQWVWSTFEQVDNVPGTSTEPMPPGGIPLSFNDPTKPQSLTPATKPPPISVSNPPVATPTPMQVVRQLEIPSETMTTNAGYWALPEIQGTVWQNYMLVMTQWPTKTSPETPDNDGAPFPSSGTELANTTMETYFQSGPSARSCMSCHQLSNSTGRDFVMFVTMDALRPAAPTPADLFAEKLPGGRLFQKKPSTLAQDPLIRELQDVFNRAENTGKPRTDGNVPPQ